jgi:hypothetical protein
MVQVAVSKTLTAATPQKYMLLAFTAQDSKGAGTVA